MLEYLQKQVQNIISEKTHRNKSCLTLEFTSNTFLNITTHCVVGRGLGDTHPASFMTSFSISGTSDRPIQRFFYLFCHKKLRQVMKFHVPSPSSFLVILISKSGGYSLTLPPGVDSRRGMNTPSTGILWWGESPYHHRNGAGANGKRRSLVLGRTQKNCRGFGAVKITPYTISFTFYCIFKNNISKMDNFNQFLRRLRRHIFNIFTYSYGFYDNYN